MQKLREDQVQKASVLLTQCFIDNPMFRYLISNEQKRIHFLNIFFECLVMLHVKNGNMYTTSENIEGVVAFGEAHLMPDVDWIFKWHVLKVLIKELSIFDVFKLVVKIKRCRGVVIENDFELKSCELNYTMQLLAIEPRYRQQGYARSLIEPLIFKVKCSDARCTLVTELTHNVCMYEYFGFVVFRKLIFKKDNWEQYMMIYDTRQHSTC